MNAVWYESQLFGVVVGAVLGFVFSQVPNQIRDRRVRTALSRGLHAEIELIVTEKRDRLSVYENYVRTLRSGGLCSIFASGRMSDAVFQANAGNIGLLRNNLVSDLVVFYNRVEQFHTRVVALQSLLERYNNSTDTSVDKEFMIAAFQKTIDLMTEIITLGEELAPRLL